jgi:heme/copper-type cytochrome/quinol oxidase subunit 2
MTLIAQSVIPRVWGSSPVSREIWALFDLILAIGIITGIIVMGSLLYVVLRFRERATHTAGN